MAEDIVTENRFRAGERYIRAIEGLGFSVDYALWTISAESHSASDIQLSIVSRMIETAGTKAVYQLLFMAFEHAATPREIDPWIVSLYGTKTKFADHLPSIPLMQDIGFMTVKTDNGLVNQETPVWHKVLDRLTRPSWIYKLKQFEGTAHSDDWAYERFRRNVEALAA